MPKKPFAKPAFDQTHPQVQNAIATELGKSVVRTMKKYLK